jgi:uracil-DNA glycosylase
MNVQIDESWNDVLKAEFNKPYFANIVSYLKDEKKRGEIIYPPGQLIFNAFNKTPFNNVRVVMIGQDPYHGINQAHGLCFSVQHSIKIPPSLVNIYKEIKTDYPMFKTPTHGNLESWAEQGVFLLNAILTVRANTPASHAKIGWEEFTNAVISILSDQKQHLVFFLWGAYAKSKSSLIDGNKHLILQSGHPSFADSHKQFFGNRHFISCNNYLTEHQIVPINWQN